MPTIIRFIAFLFFPLMSPDFLEMHPIKTLRIVAKEIFDDAKAMHKNPMSKIEYKYLTFGPSA